MTATLENNRKQQKQKTKNNFKKEQKKKKKKPGAGPLACKQLWELPLVHTTAATGVCLVWIDWFGLFFFFFFHCSMLFGSTGCWPVHL
jgi:hypothetical protein